MKEFITLEEIYDAYYQCRRRKRRTSSALDFEMHYERELRKLWKELNEGKYNISKSIVFGVTRPKHREVFAANFRDRIVHHLLMMKLEKIIESEMIDNSYSCRKGKGVEYGLKTLQKQINKVSDCYNVRTYALQCDIQGFFMSINKDLMFKKVKELMLNKWGYGNIEFWINLVEKIIKNRPELNCEIRGDKTILDNLPDNKTLFRGNGKGLPIGNLNSQIFGNYYLCDFDKMLLKEIGETMEYGRYVDDFYIIGRDKEQMLKLIDKIRNFLKVNNQLTLHPNKISITDVRKGIKFIGGVVKPWGIYVGNRTVYNAFYAFSYFKNHNLEQYVQRLNSYFGFMRHRLSYGIRYNLYKTIKKTPKIICVDMKKFKLIKSLKYKKKCGQKLKSVKKALKQ